MRKILVLCVVVFWCSTAFADSSSLLSEEVKPFEPRSLPERPKPLLELGSNFLGTGPVPQPIALPTGQSWQPQLTVFGTLRSAVQIFDDGQTKTSEWANRLDLFANLQLSGTERILIGFRPLDRNGSFAGYQFEPDQDDGWVERFDGNVETLFFEGDLGEMFPGLDSDDSSKLDFGISVGRQPLFYQEGMLVNDTVDTVGLIRNSSSIPGVSNLLLGAIFGWDEINRSNNVEDEEARLFGFVSEADTRWSTINAELLYVDSDEQQGDGVFAGLSAVQRLGHFNTSIRAMGSIAIDEESDRVGDGALLFSELSFTPVATHNIAYLNTFIGLNDFTSAARNDAAGGPLGRVGILYEAVGIGRYRSALSNDARDATGFGLGYQMFSKDTRKQVIMELGGRQNIDGPSNGSLALASRFQIALGQRFIIILDGFGALNDKRDNSWGGRLEFLVKT